MPSVLLAALEGTGGTRHCRGIARALLNRGHEVVVVAPHGAADPYRRLGCAVHEVPGPPSHLAREQTSSDRRIGRMLTNVVRQVVEPLPEQRATVAAVIERSSIEVVVTDPMLLGASLTAVLPQEHRPPVLMLGLSAPWLPDPRVGAFGSGLAPAEEGTNRLRVAAGGLVAAQARSRFSAFLAEQVERSFGVPFRGDLRSLPGLADVWAQLTVPQFEYPRRALPEGFRFVGPIRPPDDEPIPDWWHPVQEPPVIAVQAGRSASAWRLLDPTLRAFGGTENTIVVAGLTREEAEARADGGLPGNVHFEPSLPWARFIANRTVVLADGDYVDTQHALRRGIAVVVNGSSAPEVETAARAAWSGAGIDLRTDRPSADDVRGAVEEIRTDPTYRTAAARLAVQIAKTDAEESICGIVDDLVAGVPTDPRTP